MGQYYRAMLIDDDCNIQLLVSHDFRNGAKLMEHSYLGNNFVLAVYSILEKKPARLVWMGDYAVDAVGQLCNFGGGFITDKDMFSAYYQLAWEDGNGNAGKRVQYIRPSDVCTDAVLDWSQLYIVNRTKGCYIDLAQYAEQFAALEYILDPLPLLTSVGNGLGGGDYFGCRKEDAGTWAFDKISITTLEPTKLAKKIYYFSENGVALSA